MSDNPYCFFNTLIFRVYILYICFIIHIFRDCRVVLEKVSVPFGALKPHEQEHCQSEPHKKSQLNSKDKPFLNKLQLKQPILWPKSNNKEDWEDFEKAVLNSLPTFGRLTKLDLHHVGPPYHS